MVDIKEEQFTDWDRAQKEVLKFDRDTMYSPDFTTHPFVELQYEGVTVQVDKELAPLIIRMWNADIPTRFSCQGQDVPLGQDPNAWTWNMFRGYIAMPRTAKSLGFVQAILTNFLSRDSRAYNWDIEVSENMHFGPTIVIRFPKADIDEMIKFTSFVVGCGLI